MENCQKGSELQLMRCVKYVIIFSLGKLQIPAAAPVLHFPAFMSRLFYSLQSRPRDAF